MTALQVAYELEQPWLPASEGIADWGDAFHALLLGDRVRMAAFRAAITESVRPGSVVLDLGTGTGVLAGWALEAGAARVYGIDVNAGVLAVAQQRLAGWGARFVPLAGLSFDLELPERVDLIVSETLGNLVDNEGCVPILSDARRRFLAPGGALLPARAQSYLVPVETPAGHAAVAAGTVCGGDVASLGVERFGTYYDMVVPAAAHLAGGRLLRAYEFSGEPADWAVSRSFLVQRDGVCTGFKGWFVADLSDTVTMDISGDDIDAGLASDSWKHCYLPIAEPIPVRAGDRITVRLARQGTGPLGQRYRWSGAAHRGALRLGRFEHRSGPQ